MKPVRHKGVVEATIVLLPFVWFTRGSHASIMLSAMFINDDAFVSRGQVVAVATCKDQLCSKMDLLCTQHFIYVPHTLVSRTVTTLTPDSGELYEISMRLDVFSP